MGRRNPREFRKGGASGNGTTRRMLHMCQKGGQSVPVGVGLPTTLVSEITVGGTRA